MAAQTFEFRWGIISTGYIAARFVKVHLNHHMRRITFVLT